MDHPASLHNLSLLDPNGYIGHLLPGGFQHRLECWVEIRGARESRFSPELTSWPCSSIDGGFSTTIVCDGLDCRAAGGPWPKRWLPPGGATADPAVTGVTKWHTEHLTHDALLGYMSIMLQPPQTMCWNLGTCSQKRVATQHPCHVMHQFVSTPVSLRGKRNTGRILPLVDMTRECGSRCRPNSPRPLPLGVRW